MAPGVEFAPRFSRARQLGHALAPARISHLLSWVNPAGEKETGGKPLIKRLQPKPGMNNEVFALAEGEVVLQWPNQMSPESYEDFKDWLELITRKAKRMVEKKALDTEAADQTNA